MLLNTHDPFERLLEIPVPEGCSHLPGASNSESSLETSAQGTASRKVFGSVGRVVPGGQTKGKLSQIPSMGHLSRSPPRDTRQGKVKGRALSKTVEVILSPRKGVGTQETWSYFALFSPCMSL